MASSSFISAVGKRLEGKVALITGGARGLGSVTAKLFQEHGAKVLIADIQDGPSVQNASFIHCDVTNESHIKNAVEKVISMNGKLDIMFNNAGILDSIKANILNCNQADFEHVLRVNVTGAFLGTKHAARVMKQARQGTIINTASICSVIGGVATHAYASSKHAVLGLTRNTAVELGPYGIRVNCVSPFVFPSSMSRNLLGREEHDQLDDIGLNLKGVNLTAEDVARAVMYLASDESRCVSGHNLVLDGGFTIANSSLTIFTE